jgi:glyoxylase-like metal-dependent hydrolase (beta-lactamase superfamily II)
MAAGAAVAVGAFVQAFAQLASQTPTADSAQIRMRTLRPGDIVYVLIGGGGNSLAMMRDDGVVLIDTKLPAGGRQILETIQAVSDRPVATIINTHAHLDHAGGNTAFEGVKEIVAHERARAVMERLPAFQGDGARFLPNRTVTDRMSLLDGPDRIDLYYFGAGHTDGDLVVVFPEKRIAYFGDLFPSKSAPVIDTEHGGSGVAFPDTLAKAVAAINGVVQVVTGHEEGLSAERDPRTGSVDISTPRTMRWADVQEYSQFTRDFLEEVRRAIVAGKSAAEAASSLSLPEKYKDYDMRNARASVEAIYRELRR